jgi:hypothetical protein
LGVDSKKLPLRRNAVVLLLDIMTAFCPGVFK